MNSGKRHEVTALMQEHPMRESETKKEYAKRLMDIAPFNLSFEGFRHYLKNVDRDSIIKKMKPAVVTNKKNGEFNWRRVVKMIENIKDVQHDASYSQNFANLHINTDRPICVVNISDWHIGAKGTDYELLRRYTDEILETDDLFVVLTGDMLETAINLRGVKEVVSQIIEPEMQIEFLSSWLNEIKHKVLWATWDNHTVEREEKYTGFSVYKRIIGKEKQLIYHNGIGHVDLSVGSETYKIVSSHKFNGRSYLKPIGSQQRYMRFEGQDREIAMSGDSHKVGYMWYTDGDRERLAINGGTLHTASGYAQRYFSLFTIPKFPCVVLHPDEHLFVPFQSVGAWKKTVGK